MKLAVIGGVAAGMSAAARAKRRNKSLEITVYEKSGYVSYGACGLPYFIKGDIPTAEKLVVRTPEQFAKQGIRALVHHEVIDVDVTEHTVTVKNLETGEVFQDGWDELLITTGAVAVKPPIPGLDLPGVFTLRTVEDGVAIKDWIAKKHPWQAVVVGGGYIGLEMAEALAANGLYVDVVEMLPQVLPNMDADMAALVEEELSRHGVTVHLESPVRAFEGDGRVERVIAGDKTLEADLVLMDRMGELVNGYAVSDLVVLGGAFEPVGGHNAAEAAQFGMPILTGPHGFNQREIFAGIEGLKIVEKEELPGAMEYPALLEPTRLKIPGDPLAPIVEELHNVLQG
jgi:NADPH-dependent 2,4-dienoyl-CoA reductase/sulfur reductase-like enzyme